MFTKYAEMLAAGADDANVTAEMKADGLAIPERSAAWAVIKPRVAKVAAPAPVAAPETACKFQQAAAGLTKLVRGTAAEKFVADVASGLPSLSAKQKKWLKTLCEKHGVDLSYAPRAVVAKSKATRFTNRDFVPYESLDIPVWSEQLGCWVDAEY